MKYIKLSSWAWWKYCWQMRHADALIGRFDNARCNGGRWGFFIGGFEVGSRSPGDPVGTWLACHGLWPW